MPRMPDFEAEIKRDFRWFGEHAEHILHIGDDVQPVVARERVIGVDPYATQATAAAAATVEAAPAAQQEEPMSVAAELETWYAEAKAKLAEAEQKLPVLVADAKKIEGNPVADVAIQAAEHVAATVIPPEALTYLGTVAKNALDGLLSLYNPAGTAAPAAPAEPAPAA